LSEAFVLRSYPFKEADLVVSFLTRDQGKLRGVAKRARRPKSPFGSGLERLSQVRMSYFQRETRELVNLDSCELLVSQFRLLSDYRAAVALDFFAEVTDQLLPPGEPNDRFFRLLTTVLEHLRAADSADPGRVWRAVTYFSLWAVRLSGFLPDLHVCLGCGSLLADGETRERAFFIRGRDGLMCAECRRAAGSGSWELSVESRSMAEEMLRKPVAQIGRTGWVRETCADLRRLLVQQIEAHIERKLITVPVLEAE
jgi:DNA repair protein RecO (recombination protein O)